MIKYNKNIILMTYLVFLVIALISVTGCDNITYISQDDPDNLDKEQDELDTNVLELGGGTYYEYDFTPDEDVKTLTFSSQIELENFIGRYESGSYYNRYYEEGIAFEDVGNFAVDDAAKSNIGSSIAEKDYSGTNNQVATVDEADMLKTDGEYIYTITNNVLYIVKAYPEDDAEVVASISFDAENPTSLFINGDKLAVFGNFYDYNFYDRVNFIPRSGMTFFNLYDISQREDPKLLKEYKFEGDYFDGRMNGDYIYLLTRTGLYDRPVPMPVYFDGEEKSTIAVDDIYYFPIEYSNPQFVNVHAVSISDIEEGINSKSIAVEYGQNLYVSENNIFITYQERLDEYEMQKEIVYGLLEDRISDSKKELINKIKEVDNDILSLREKKQKIENIYTTYIQYLSSDEQSELEKMSEEILEEELKEIKYFEYTVINKVEVDGNKITPKANGKVPGRIINQFSLDENKDVLRIATTIRARWSSMTKERTESTNNIYALNSELEQIGKLEGLAEGESIYSTRFIEDRLYMVTFRQIDPFFVIDLSDPEEIKELGELKIPGFSRYLHPYDKDFIIGIGQDATETGTTKGLKISLFDVSDVEKPEEVAKYVTDERYATSSVLYEHKAFLFSKDKNLLVIPAYNNDRLWDGTKYVEGEDNYNGAFVFHIDTEDIELRGLIDHSGGVNSGYYYGAQVERSLYIEDMLYTKSPKIIRINDLDDLHSVKNVTLEVINKKIPVY